MDIQQGDRIHTQLCVAADLISPMLHDWNMELVFSLFHPALASKIVNIPLHMRTIDDQNNLEILLLC